MARRSADQCESAGSSLSMSAPRSCIHTSGHGGSGCSRSDALERRKGPWSDARTLALQFASAIAASPCEAAESTIDPARATSTSMEAVVPSTFVCTLKSRIASSTGFEYK
eukprot:scaffold117574_cov32-Tisochrysis_lutea.AAC.5